MIRNVRFMFLTFTRTINSISKRSFVSLRQYEHTKVITFVYVYITKFLKSFSQLKVPVASLWPGASEFPFRNGIEDEIVVFKSVLNTICVSDRNRRERDPLTHFSQ